VAVSDRAPNVIGGVEMAANPTSYPRNVTASEIEAELGPFDAISPIGDRSGSGECWLVRDGVDQAVIKIIVHEHEPGQARETCRAGRGHRTRL
jgi:hypothetical protein